MAEEAIKPNPPVDAAALMAEVEALRNQVFNKQQEANKFNPINIESLNKLIS